MAKKFKFKTEVRPITLKFLLGAVLLMALFWVLSGLGIIDYSDKINPYFFPIVMPLIVLLDLGIWGAIKSRGKTLKKTSGLERVGLVISGLYLFNITLEIFGASIELLSGFQVFLGIATGLYVIYVILNK